MKCEYMVLYIELKTQIQEKLRLPHMYDVVLTAMCSIELWMMMTLILGIV